MSEPPLDRILSTWLKCAAVVVVTAREAAAAGRDVEALREIGHAQSLLDDARARIVERLKEATR